MYGDHGDLAERLYEAARQRDAAGPDSEVYAYFARKAEACAAELADLETGRWTSPPEAPVVDKAARAQARNRTQARELGRAAAGFLALGLLLVLGAGRFGVPWSGAWAGVYAVGGLLLAAGCACIFGSSRAHARALMLSRINPPQPAVIRPASALERSEGGSILPFRASSE